METDYIQEAQKLLERDWLGDPRDSEHVSLTRDIANALRSAEIRGGAQGLRNTVVVLLDVCSGLQKAAEDLDDSQAHSV